jgi:hypothetical protein
LQKYNFLFLYGSSIKYGKCADLGLWIQILTQKWVNTKYSEGLGLGEAILFLFKIKHMYEIIHMFGFKHFV